MGLAEVRDDGDPVAAVARSRQRWTGIGVHVDAGERRVQFAPETLGVAGGYLDASVASACRRSADPAL
jgi:hypothetical protein